MIRLLHKFIYDVIGYKCIWQANDCFVIFIYGKSKERDCRINALRVNIHWTVHRFWQPAPVSWNAWWAYATKLYLDLIRQIWKTIVPHALKPSINNAITQKPNHCQTIFRMQLKTNTGEREYENKKFRTFVEMSV